MDSVTFEQLPTSEETLPKYRIVPAQGGWKISTPYNREHPSRFARATVYPLALSAMLYVRDTMGIAWQDIAWMANGDTHIGS